MQIFYKIGLYPTTHEPCLYLGLIKNGNHLLFLHQVDDFAIACTDESTANILLYLIDDELTIPMRRMGLLDLYNGLDVIQTCDFIKLNCSTYIKKISENISHYG